MVLFYWHDSWGQCEQSKCFKVIFYLQGFQLCFYWFILFLRNFFLPVHPENYLRVAGAKMRWKDCSIGSQSWIVIPFSVFYRVVSCWLSVVRGCECRPLIGRLPALPLVDSNCCSTAWNWSFTSQISPSASGFGPAFAGFLRNCAFSVFSSKVKWLVEIYVIKPQSRLIRYFFVFVWYFLTKRKRKICIFLHVCFSRSCKSEVHFLNVVFALFSFQISFSTDNRRSNKESLVNHFFFFYQRQNCKQAETNERETTDFSKVRCITCKMKFSVHTSVKSVPWS